MSLHTKAEYTRIYTQASRTQSFAFTKIRLKLCLIKHKKKVKLNVKKFFFCIEKDKFENMQEKTQ